MHVSHSLVDSSCVHNVVLSHLCRNQSSTVSCHTPGFLPQKSASTDFCHINSAADRKEVLANAKKLREPQNQQFNQVYIRPDLTKKQCLQSKKPQNSTEKTAGRKSKQTVLDQTRQDHRKSGDRLITTKPLSTVLVMYSNVDNSLLSKLDELRVLTHTNKYDIITLTEIKPKHGTLPDPESLQINGYTLYLGDLANTNSRGVCCYVNDKLSSEIILTPEQYNDSVWVRVMVDDQSNLSCWLCIS